MWSISAKLSGQGSVWPAGQWLLLCAPRSLGLSVTELSISQRLDINPSMSHCAHTTMTLFMFTVPEEFLQCYLFNWRTCEGQRRRRTRTTYTETQIKGSYLYFNDDEDVLCLTQRTTKLSLNWRNFWSQLFHHMDSDRNISTATE